MADKDKDFVIQFGNHIRKLRADRKWSQDDLSEHSGVDRVQIERIENARINTSISVAAQLAKGFGIRVPDIFDFEVERAITSTVQ